MKTNKSLKAEWDQRRKNVLEVIRDLALIKFGWWHIFNFETFMWLHNGYLSFDRYCQSFASAVNLSGIGFIDLARVTRVIDG